MAQSPARIVREVHDEPHIQGSRITVRHVYERVHGQGLHPETVAERHDLDIADVYHALAYYHDHLDEMRRIEQERARIVEEYRERAITDPTDLE